jgi:hypothetical protein
MVRRLHVATCKARKPDGHACLAKARTGSDFCFFHDPELSDARRQAQCRGGRKQTRFHVIPSQTPAFDFSNSIRITEVLEYAANRLVQGELDHKSAYVLGYLADCALRAHKVVALEQRIAEVERLIHTEKEILLGLPEYLNMEFDRPVESGAKPSE